MRGIIIVSCTSSVVFHTAPFSRDVVDNIVAIVESDIQVKALSDLQFVSSSSSSPPTVSTGGGGGPNNNSSSKGRQRKTFQATLRKASLHRHGGQDLVHTARWLEADHKRLCEGLLCVYVAEHAWLGAMMKSSTDGPQGGGSILVLWRKCGDRVIIFVLDQEEPLALARSAMSNFVLLLCEAFDKPSSTTTPSLKDLISRSDLVQACCSCIAPQHVLALAPIAVCRSMLQRLLAAKSSSK